MRTRRSLEAYLISVPRSVRKVPLSDCFNHLYHPSNYDTEYDERGNELPTYFPPTFHMFPCHLVKVF